jgi:hypothetical protein
VPRSSTSNQKGSGRFNRLLSWQPVESLTSAQDLSLSFHRFVSESRLSIPSLFNVPIFQICRCRCCLEYFRTSNELDHFPTMNPVIRRGVATAIIFAVLSLTLYFLSVTPNYSLDDTTSQFCSDAASKNGDVDSAEVSEIKTATIVLTSTVVSTQTIVSTPTIPSKPVECDPYQMPGSLLFDQNFENPRYESFDDECKPAAKSWISRIQESFAKELPIPELQNKEVLLIGDSVDRETVQHLCTELGLKASQHKIFSYQAADTGQEAHLLQSVPNSCVVKHLNLTISNWFFYGFDEDNIWSTPKNPQIPEIGKFSLR